MLTLESGSGRRNPSQRTEDLIQIVSPTGHFIYANTTWKQTLGYHDAELATLSLFDIADEATCQLMQRIFDSEGEIPRNPELVLRTKTGQWVILSGDMQCQFQRNRVLCAHGFFRDVTALRREEQARAHCEPPYRLLIENVVDIVATSDPSGHITSLNPAFESLLGYKRSEWIGKHFMPLVHEEDRTLTQDMFYRALKGVACTAFELRILKKCGEYAYIEPSLRSFNRGKELLGVLCVARDISKRKIVEQALRESEERFRLFVDACFEGFVIHEGGKVLETNDFMARLIGTAKESLVGKNIFSYIAPEYRDEVLKNIERNFQDKYVVKLSMPGGGRTLVEIRARSIPYQGKTVRVVAVHPIQRS